MSSTSKQTNSKKVQSLTPDRNNMKTSNQNLKGRKSTRRPNRDLSPPQQSQNSKSQPNSPNNNTVTLKKAQQKLTPPPSPKKAINKDSKINTKATQTTTSNTTTKATTIKPGTKNVKQTGSTTKTTASSKSSTASLEKELNSLNVLIPEKNANAKPNNQNKISSPRRQNNNNAQNIQKNVQNATNKSNITNKTNNTSKTNNINEKIDTRNAPKINKNTSNAQTNRVTISPNSNQKKNNNEIKHFSSNANESESNANASLYNKLEGNYQFDQSTEFGDDSMSYSTEIVHVDLNAKKGSSLSTSNKSLSPPTNKSPDEARPRPIAIPGINDLQKVALVFSSSQFSPMSSEKDQHNEEEDDEYDYDYDYDTGYGSYYSSSHSSSVSVILLSRTPDEKEGIVTLHSQRNSPKRSKHHKHKNAQKDVVSEVEEEDDDDTNGPQEYIKTETIKMSNIQDQNQNLEMGLELGVENDKIKLINKSSNDPGTPRRYPKGKNGNINLPSAETEIANKLLLELPDRAKIDDKSSNSSRNSKNNKNSSNDSRNTNRKSNKVVSSAENVDNKSTKKPFSRVISPIVTEEIINKKCISSESQQSQADQEDSSIESSSSFSKPRPKANKISTVINYYIPGVKEGQTESRESSSNSNHLNNKEELSESESESVPIEEEIIKNSSSSKSTSSTKKYNENTINGSLGRNTNQTDSTSETILPSDQFIPKRKNSDEISTQSSNEDQSTKVKERTMGNMVITPTVDNLIGSGKTSDKKNSSSYHQEKVNENYSDNYSDDEDETINDSTKQSDQNSNPQINTNSDNQTSISDSEYKSQTNSFLTGINNDTTKVSSSSTINTYDSSLKRRSVRKSRRIKSRRKVERSTTQTNSLGLDDASEYEYGYDYEFYYEYDLTDYSKTDTKATKNKKSTITSDRDFEDTESEPGIMSYQQTRTQVYAEVETPKKPAKSRACLLI